MAVDEQLAERVRGALGGVDGLEEKRMFGGLAFLLHGNMSVGVHGEDLIVRLAPEQTEEALAEPGVRVFDMTGRPMKGWVLVGPEATASEDGLGAWVTRGLDFAESLPPK
jgi:TfoX/Sxy family transcriptional regulator of competence genes